MSSLLTSSQNPTADNQPYTPLNFTGDTTSASGLCPTAAGKERSLCPFLPGNVFTGDAKPTMDIMRLSTDRYASADSVRELHTLD